MATVIVGTTLAVVCLPAAAATTATQPEGSETSISYFNNAQHSEVVGIVDTSTCYTYKWGIVTSYYITITARCN